MKKHIFLIIQGIILGEFIGQLFSLLFSYLYGLSNYVPSAPTFTNHFSRPLNAVLVSVILWGLMGLVFSAGALVYKNERWSIRKKTIINFIIYYCGFAPLAILAGWFPLTLINFSIFTGIFILIFIVMWFINMNIAKRELNQINKKIKSQS
ncbi:DUF3021 domain-containing protein [Lactobacillus agrestimuris]|uniref:DUF3021 domain-containing protein n=1 Tax=Lactobacillus agrestimuris TaxID=2941328 RepID=UPI0020438B14|nr:DUF3021 domain-containing protein [Lactobacillus agrestimuris]